MIIVLVFRAIGIISISAGLVAGAGVAAPWVIHNLQENPALAVFGLVVFGLAVIVLSVMIEMFLDEI